MSHRPLAIVTGLTVGDYFLWNWSLSGSHDVLALVSGLSLPPLAAASVWLIALTAARLLGRATRRAHARPTASSASATSTTGPSATATATATPAASAPARRSRRPKPSRSIARSRRALRRATAQAARTSAPATPRTHTLASSPTSFAQRASDSSRKLAA